MYKVGICFLAFTYRKHMSSADPYSTGVEPVQTNEGPD